MIRLITAISQNNRLVGLVLKSVTEAEVKIKDQAAASQTVRPTGIAD